LSISHARSLLYARIFATGNFSFSARAHIIFQLNFRYSHTVCLRTIQWLSTHYSIFF